MGAITNLGGQATDAILAALGLCVIPLIYVAFCASGNIQLLRDLQNERY